jgi:hypothetical protein
MKFEPHKWPLVRLFRKSDTSVPPKIEGEADRIDGPTHPLDDIGNHILKQLQALGMIPPGSEVRVSHRPLTVMDGEVREIPRPGIKPPLDAGTEGWTWSQWSKEAGAGGVIPGWAFCRFANRLGPENVGFVFGHVRGGFGVWRQPFDVCTTSDEGVGQRPEILTCITHLLTGMGVGIFADRDTAIVAAELAEKVCPSWHSLAPTELSVWRENMGRTLAAWHGIGIREATNAHAHDRHGTRFQIYGQDNETVMAGKPERLS